jgi:hypothetical protein
MSGVLPKSNAMTGVQGFAPKQIIDQANGTLDTTHLVAFCFPNDDVTYQLNGAGETISLPAGTVRCVADGISSIVFSAISGTAKLEIM